MKLHKIVRRVCAVFLYAVLIVVVIIGAPIWLLAVIIRGKDAREFKIRI